MSSNVKREKICNECISCASCVKHYANLRGEYFIVTGACHCINENMSLRERNKRMSNLAVCEHWQPREIQVSKRKECIKDMLYDIANKLEDIASTLKEDN